MLVGEQPGDKEDIVGKPFAGPAGRVLDQALEEAGIPREEVFVTNAVKHFKHDMRGKWRLHKRLSRIAPIKRANTGPLWPTCARLRNFCNSTLLREHALSAAATPLR